VRLSVLVVDDEDLPRQRVVDLVRAHPRLSLVGEAADGASALDAIVEHRPDLVFLDIQMPELDGFQVIAALDDDMLPAIVFVTAYDEYAIRAFEVDAIDYLLKPVTAQRFEAAVTRALSRIDGRNASLEQPIRTLASRASVQRGTPVRRFVARRGGKHYFVPVADIDWIEAEGNYVRLHAGERAYLIREKIGTLEEKLDPDAFARVHRSTIVNLSRVRELVPLASGDFTIRMKDGKELRLSRGYRQKQSERVGEYA